MYIVALTIIRPWWLSHHSANQKAVFQWLAHRLSNSCFAVSRYNSLVSFIYWAYKLTIIRRRWCEYWWIKTEKKSRFLLPIFIEPEVNNCFSIITKLLISKKPIKYIKTILCPQLAQNGLLPFWKHASGDYSVIITSWATNQHAEFSIITFVIILMSYKTKEESISTDPTWPSSIVYT